MTDAPREAALLASADPTAPWSAEGHMHLAHQPCLLTFCEPVERLRCACLGVWNDPDFRDQCHLRATQEDGRCDDCRDRCEGAPMVTVAQAEARPPVDGVSG